MLLPVANDQEWQKLTHSKWSVRRKIAEDALAKADRLYKQQRELRRQATLLEETIGTDKIMGRRSCDDESKANGG